VHEYINFIEVSIENFEIVKAHLLRKLKSMNPAVDRNTEFFRSHSNDHRS
jgi:hypothetical protein